MPSGAKKRKAAKKKKVHDSSTTNTHQGENDGGELSSPASQDNHNAQDPSVEVEKREDDSSENKSKDAIEEASNIEIEIGSKSKSSNGSSSSSSDSSDDESHVLEKKVVVLESAPIESVPAIESLPEKVIHKVEELEISPIVDPVKPVDSLLQEVSKVYDETKNEERKELVVGETPDEVVIGEIALKDDCPTSSVVESVSKDNGVVELPSLDEKASSESKEYVASSTPPKGSVSQVSGADRANEIDTIGHSGRQPAVASTPLAERKTTSWKSCCGMFELFSGSER